jgi:hypothetical protein
VKRRRLAIVVAAGLCAGRAQAQTRPLLTEEATTAPAKTIVFETGGDFIAQEPNYLTDKPRDRYDGPLLRIVYSPADNVELDLEWVMWVGVIDDPDFGNASDQGDVSLRAKVRFIDGGTKGTTLGARFRVTLPETSFGNGLGPNTLRMGADMLLSQPIGRAALHVNAGLFLHDQVLQPHEQADFFAYGAAVTCPVGARLELVGEVAGRAGYAAPGADEHSEVRAGFRWRSGRIQWDAAVRRGLAAADGTWGVTAGLAWTIRGGS